MEKALGNVRRLALVAVVSVGFAVVVACGGESSTITMGAERATLASCLAGIESATGFGLDVVTDKPHRVSGYLEGTRLHFGCTRRESGTKGVFWESWYDWPKPGASLREHLR